MWILFLKIIFYATIGTQLFFWWGMFRKLAYFTPSTAVVAPNTHPISVIVCARNESHNLKNNLYDILNQSYSDFELIVVNDDSTDDTAEVLEAIQTAYPQKLRILSLSQKTILGKKGALAAGIAQAKYDIVLLTDADCKPNSPFWIQYMSNALSADKDIVLGYSPYLYHKEILNLVIRYETLWTGIQYLSFALSGKAYMGVGRNLMYRKSCFTKINGFQSHTHIASGDDDLFINQIANAQNTSICIEKAAQVISQPKRHVTDWLTQKQRHFQTGRYYRLEHQFLLTILNVSHYLQIIIFFFLVVLGFSTIFESSVLVLRMITAGWLYGRIIKRLQEERLFRHIWWLEWCMPLIYLLFTPTMMHLPFVKVRRWK